MFSKYRNTTEILKKELKLNTAQIDLLKTYLSKETYLNKELLAKSIKKFPLEIIGNFELKKLPNQFCIGEMLDWDAPTGGYLLQACASMGVYLADCLNKHLY